MGIVERLRDRAKFNTAENPQRLMDEAADEIERMRSERAYIIGFNDGWESAHEQHCCSSCDGTGKRKGEQ